MRFEALLATTLLSLTGCVVAVDGGDRETGLATDSVQDSVIVGAVDWEDVNAIAQTSAERRKSRAVGYLSIPARGQRCTAFLIAPDVVMTNEHCIPAAWAAEGASVSFRRESGVTWSQQQAATFSCSTFLGNDAVLDYALLRCSGRPGDTFGVLGLEARGVNNGHDVYVVHQNCDYYAEQGCDPVKRISFGEITGNGQEYGHDADTLGGSSGSPVLAGDDHRVLALHHVGLGNQGDGRGYQNRAVRMSDILPELAVRFPSLELGEREPTFGTTPVTPVQSSDSYEPNDSVANAASLSLPFVAQGLRIGSGTDRDFFAFDVGGSSTERAVRIDFTHAAGDLDLYVWTTSGQLVASSTGTGNIEEIRGVLAAGRYVVEVMGYRGATGSYDLRLQ